MASIACSVAAPITVPRLVVNPSMARVSVALVLGWWHDQLGEVGEGDDPDARPGDLVLDELLRRVLGAGEAVRRHVGGAHRTRHIEGEDDRRLVERDIVRDPRPRRADASARRWRRGTVRDGTWRRQRDRLGIAWRIRAMLE